MLTSAMEKKLAEMDDKTCYMGWRLLFKHDRQGRPPCSQQRPKGDAMESHKISESRSYKADGIPNPNVQKE